MAAIRMANYHGGLAYLSSRDDTSSNGSSPRGASTGPENLYDSFPTIQR